MSPVSDVPGVNIKVVHAVEARESEPPPALLAGVGTTGSQSM